jgi:hypothetical protein
MQDQEVIMTDRTDHTTTLRRGSTATAIDWLESEFPGWTIDVDRTASWHGEHRPLWIARCPGHHPQSELTAAKLHTRLTDYLDREQRRRAMMN